VGSGFLTRCHYRISRPLSMKKNAIFDDSPRGADFRAAQKRAHTLVLEPILRLPGPLSRRISYASGLFFTLAMHLRLLTNFPLRHLRLPLRPAQQRFASQTPRLLDQPLFRSVRLLQIAVRAIDATRFRTSGWLRKKANSASSLKSAPVISFVLPNHLRQSLLRIELNRTPQRTVRPVFVVAFAISAMATSTLVSGVPRQVWVKWQNMRCSILFHFDVPGG